MRRSSEFVNLILKLLMVSLFVVGALVFSYPFVVDSINNYHDQRVIEEYIHNASEAENAHKQAELEKKNEALNENKEVLNVPGIGLVEDPFDVSSAKLENPKDEYFNSHLLGVVYVPKIQVSLPIFDETNATLLERGATYLQGTSFPVGGDFTHSVITAHSGLPDKKLFTDLYQMKEGDVFYLKVAGEILAYVVVEVKTVDPYDTDSIKIQDNRDLMTLLTCTPYMINTHRLLVTGERSEVELVEVLESIQLVESYHSNRVYVIISLLVVFLVLSVLWAFRKYTYYKKTKRQYELRFRGVEGVEYGLFNRFGREVHSERVVCRNGIVDFGLVNGATFRVRSFNSKTHIRARVKRLSDKQFKVDQVVGLIKRVVLSDG